MSSRFGRFAQLARERVYSILVVARLTYRYQKPKVAPVLSGESVLIAPANSAGQGFAWARALEGVSPRSSAIAMEYVHEERTFRHRSDLTVLNGFTVHSRAWQKAQQKVLSSYRAVLVESGLPVLGGRFGSDVLRQIRALVEKGVQVALIFHGSDLRDPDTHMKIEPLSYFAEDSSFTDTMRLRVARSRQIVKNSGLPVFVSTPDLLDEVENAIWLPVVVDLQTWAGSPEPFTKGKLPVVMHAPSSAHIKGSSLIEPVLEQLDSEGVIDYRRVVNVPHSRMPQLMSECDVVVDQMRGGPYGVVACEAMAAGKVVISHVREEVRAHVRATSGRELPIIEAVPDTLEEVIRELINSPETGKEVAKRGEEFVSYWHDGEQSGKVLAAWLAEANSKPGAS